MLITTAGAANANAYGEIAYLNDYAVATAWAASWEALDDDDELTEPLAIRATRALDTLSFAGYPASTTQALQFPRAGVITPWGVALDDDVIPDAILRAWAHIATWLSSFPSTTDPFSVSAKTNVKSKTVGPLTTEYFGPPVAEGSTFLASVIVPMLRPLGIVGPAGVVRLTR